MSSKNESVWAGKFPSNLKWADCERGIVSKLGGNPPICLVPTVSKEDKDRATTTIKLGDTLKDTYPKFAGGDAKSAIRHVFMFLNLVKKLEYREDFEALEQIEEEQQRQLDELNIDEASSAADRSQARELEKEIRDAGVAKRECLKKFWALFERLLDTSLVAEWQRLVELECRTDGHIGLDGVRFSGQRGESFDSLDWCIHT